MTFLFRRLMEIKEEQLWMERKNCCNIKEILKVLKKEKYVYWEKDNTKIAIDVRRKDGKRKISRKN